QLHPAIGNLLGVPAFVVGRFDAAGQILSRSRGRFTLGVSFAQACRYGQHQCDCWYNMLVQGNPAILWDHHSRFSGGEVRRGYHEADEVTCRCVKVLGKQLDLTALRSHFSCGIGDLPRRVEFHVRNVLILVFALTLAGWTQERAVDPTWLHRYIPDLSEAKIDMTTGTCHYKAIFGEGDPEKRLFRSVVRFGEVTLDAHGACGPVS